MNRNPAHAYSARPLQLLEQEPQIAEYEMHSLERGAAFDEFYFQSIRAPVGLALDLGCGSGRLTLALAERAQFVIGLDVSPTMLTLAQERGGAQSNVRWTLGSAHCLPFPASSFEMIVSSSVLRLTDLPRALSEIERVLKPMGRVAIRDVMGVRASRVPEPIGKVRWAIAQSIKMTRRFGFRVGWKLLHYRFSKGRKEYCARQLPRTRNRIEEQYGSILPGSHITWGPKHLFVTWEKPPSQMQADE